MTNYILTFLKTFNYITLIFFTRVCQNFFTNTVNMKRNQKRLFKKALQQKHIL